MRSRVFPILCLVAAIAVLLLFPNAKEWGDFPTAADLFACTLTIIGILTWEIRDAVRTITEAQTDSSE